MMELPTCSLTDRGYRQFARAPNSSRSAAHESHSSAPTHARVATKRRVRRTNCFHVQLERCRCVQVDCPQVAAMPYRRLQFDSAVA